MHVFSLKVSRKLNRLVTFVYNVKITTTRWMSLVWPPGSDTTMWVGQEVPIDKQSGGKLGGNFNIQLSLTATVTHVITTW